MSSQRYDEISTRSLELAETSRSRVSTEAASLFTAVGGSWQTAWEHDPPKP